MKRTTDERFWAKVRKGPGCWEWTGSRTARDWHGVFVLKTWPLPPVRVTAHRYAWERVNGPVPAGMEVMHACDNPICVRLDHLSLGTHQENMRDASAKGRLVRAAATHCRRGHPFEGNTYIIPKTGRRACAACIRDRDARRERDRRFVGGHEPDPVGGACRVCGRGVVYGAMGKPGSVGWRHTRYEAAARLEAVLG